MFCAPFLYKILSFRQSNSAAKLQQMPIMRQVTVDDYTAVARMSATLPILNR